VPGLLDGSVGFGGEESAGASFLQRDGGVWTTDKDGIIACLLASEILAVTGESPSAHYRKLTERFGEPAYARIDSPATREQKAVLGFTMFGLWLRAGHGKPRGRHAYLPRHAAEDHFPPPAVLGHGVFAVATVVLVLFTAIRTG